MFVAGGGNEGAFDRMKQGLIHATSAPSLGITARKKTDFIVLVRAEELSTYPISGVVAHTKKIKKKPDEIKRLIKVGSNPSAICVKIAGEPIPIQMSTDRLDQEAGTALMTLS